MTSSRSVPDRQTIRKEAVEAVEAVLDGFDNSPELPELPSQELLAALDGWEEAFARLCPWWRNWADE